MEITLGQCLLLHRTKCGLTHKELGSRVFPELNAPHQKIKKIESGVYEPKPEELSRLAKHLNVTVSDLMDVSTEIKNEGRLYIDEKLFTIFPKLKNSFEIINHAVHMERKEFVLSITIEVLKASLSAAEELYKQCTATVPVPEKDTNDIASAR